MRTSTVVLFAVVHALATLLVRRQLCARQAAAALVRAVGVCADILAPHEQVIVERVGQVVESAGGHPILMLHRKPIDSGWSPGHQDGFPAAEK